MLCVYHAWVALHASQQKEHGMHRNKRCLGCIATKGAWGASQQKVHGVHRNKRCLGCIATKGAWGASQQKVHGVHMHHQCKRMGHRPLVHHSKGACLMLQQLLRRSRLSSNIWNGTASARVCRQLCTQTNTCRHTGMHTHRLEGWQHPHSRARLVRTLPCTCAAAVVALRHKPQRPARRRGRRSGRSAPSVPCCSGDWRGVCLATWWGVWRQWQAHLVRRSMQPSCASLNLMPGQLPFGDYCRLVKVLQAHASPRLL